MNWLLALIAAILVLLAPKHAPAISHLAVPAAVHSNAPSTAIAQPAAVGVLTFVDDDGGPIVTRSDSVSCVGKECVGTEEADPGTSATGNVGNHHVVCSAGPWISNQERWICS